MQSLSVHQHDIHESLLVAKQKRDDEPRSKTTSKRTFYRWRMGANVTHATKEEPTEAENPYRQKLIREQKRNDELWLSGVVAATALAFVLLQGGRKES